MLQQACRALAASWLVVGAAACSSAAAPAKVAAADVADATTADAPLPAADVAVADAADASAATADATADALPAAATMVDIPAGTFWMGTVPGDTICDLAPTPTGCDDEIPRHQVQVGAFQIGRTEVTVAQYTACVAAGACTPAKSYGPNSTPDTVGKEQFPINGVTWDQAGAYCAWTGARLPTEAEWERAARGGVEGFMYPWGNALPTCAPGKPNQAVFTFGTEDCGKDGPVAVATASAPNAWGLYDMAGNVWEWVADWYDPKYYASKTETWINPQGAKKTTIRVVRGGSFRDGPFALRASVRGDFAPAFVFDDVGIRCARSVP